jgi:uncharacterized SAM-binding protein YcdF (DUF218 family)
MASLAEVRGLRGDRVILEQLSRDTMGNALACLPLLRNLGIGRILLVTDPPHMVRALLCFRLLYGKEFEILPRPGAWPAPWPASAMVAREIVALGAYGPRLLKVLMRDSFKANTTNPEA